MHIKGLACLRALLLTVPVILTTGATATDQPSVVFGGATEYRPFHYLTESGQPEGFDIALFEAIARETGWNTRYQLNDWSLTQQYLNEGEVDIVPMFVSRERQARYLFSSPVLKTSHYLFGRMGANPVDSLYELRNQGVTIAAEDDGYGWRRLRQLQIDEQIVATSSEADALRMVADGSADYALVTSEIGDYVIGVEGLDNVTALSPPLLPVAYAFAISPSRAELISDINIALQKLRQQGVIDNLADEWLTPPQHWHVSLRQSLWLIVPLLLAMLYIAYWLWRSRGRLRHITELADTEAERRLAAERKAEKLAVYDDLTGLPKTTFYLQYLSEAVEHARVRQQSLAVAIMTLLDLEVIQQIAGYQVMDGLIKLEAEALAREHQGFIAYLGQGRYGFIFENVDDAKDALRKTRELISIAGRQYDVGSTPIEPHVACGLAVFPEHGYEFQELYRAAELAMTMARQERQAVLAYKPEMEPDPRNLTLMSDLGRAIEANALSWAFQPKYSLAEDRVTGAEMLVRWQHPRYGALAPGIFIPLAEKTGLIKSITRSAILEAITTVRQWGDGDREMKVSVNVSGNDLADSEIVDEIIYKLGAYAPLLTLEVTETAIMKDVAAIIRNVDRMQAAGLCVSLDDYGTGYSSLSYLKQLNFDEIKIDMSFIRNMLQSEKDQKITRASIHLGHDLGAKVTAEGVEDMATADLLSKLGCDILQGYGIARPHSLDEFMKFASTYSYRN